MKNLIFFILFSGAMMLVAMAWNVDDPHMETAIEFKQGSWEEILKAARDENKVIFLDIYATWCGPCKMLKKNTFTDKEVGEYFNAHFINVTLDGEKGEGALLAKKYELHAYPTMLFIQPDGKAKAEAVGYQTPRKLLEFARKVSAQQDN